MKWTTLTGRCPIPAHTPPRRAIPPAQVLSLPWPCRCSRRHHHQEHVRVLGVMVSAPALVVEPADSITYKAAKRKYYCPTIASALPYDGTARHKVVLSFPPRPCSSVLHPSCHHVMSYAHARVPEKHASVAGHFPKLPAGAQATRPQGTGTQGHHRGAEK